jgi:hypothetical protein
METSLIFRGIVRKVGPPQPDLESCKIHKPNDVCKLGVAASAFGLETAALFMPGVWPDWLVSGYRTERETSPHAWGDAFDIKVGKILRQIEFVRKVVSEYRYFNRGGLYVRHLYKDDDGKKYIGLRNTCHIDNRDDDWMEVYSASKYWVYDLGQYKGFSDIESAAQYALHLSQQIGGVA